MYALIAHGRAGDHKEPKKAKEGTKKAVKKGAKELSRKELKDKLIEWRKKNEHRN